MSVLPLSQYEYDELKKAVQEQVPGVSATDVIAAVVLKDLEDWLDQEIDLASVRSNLVRYVALREVRDFILGND